MPRGKLPSVYPGIGFFQLPTVRMYLQSLELFGFKSFAPKTKLEFHRGVTAVVVAGLSCDSGCIAAASHVSRCVRP